MIARVLIKAGIMIAIFMAIASYVVYLKTGKFWKPSWSNVNISMPELLGSGAPNMQSITAPEEPTYKWRQGGQWHYGQKPPKGMDAIRVDE